VAKKPLGILIQAKVNVSDIDNQIKQIQDRLKEIDLTIKMDKEVLNTLRQFNKVIGDLDKATVTAMANMSRAGKSVNQIIQGANVETKKLLRQWDEVSKISDSFDGDKNFTGRKERRINKNRIVETTYDAEMKPTGYRVTQNLEQIKRKQAEFEQYSKAWTKRINDAVSMGLINDVTALKIRKRLEKISPTSIAYSSNKKDFESEFKNVTDMGKIHAQAIKENQKFEKARMDAIQKEAIEQNKLFNQKKKQQEELDKAHYTAIQENAKREQKIMESLHKEALKMNAEIDKQKFLQNKKIADLAGVDYNRDEVIRQRIADELNKKHDLTGKKAIDSNSVSLERVWDSKTQQEMIRYNAVMNDGSKLVTNYKGSIDRLTNSMYQNGSVVRNNTQAQMGFFESLGTAMQKIPVWMAGMTIFYQTLHFFTDGIAYVNELNKSLTEISIVTGQSQAGVEKLGQQYADLAGEMRVTTLELTKSATEFYRQGLNQEQVAERLRTTTQYAKISAMDVKEATEILTATVNSMNISIEHASDVFSYLGDATATGADEIGRAFQKVGGTAGALGIEFEKVASWIAVISSKTRESAETIGNSVKSIIARIQNMKEQGFDSEDGTDVNMVSKALGAVGIQLMDAEGNFRNFGQVMDELGAKWVTLSNREKAYLATTVAGSYQQARFLNIMEGYAESVDLYKQSLEAAGTTQSKYNLWLQGTEAHLNALKTAGQNVWHDTFNSQGIRNAIDLLTVLVNIIDDMINMFGAIPMFVIPATLAIFKFSETAKTGLIWFNAMMASTVQGQVSIAALTLGFQKLGLGAKAATWAVRAFQATVTLGLAFAITAVIELIADFAGKSAEAEQRLQDIEERTRNMTATYAEHGAEIEKLIQTLERYEQTNPNGEGLDTKELEDYTKTRERLIDLMPQFIEGVDEEGKKRLVNIEVMKQEIEILEKLTKIKEQEASAKFRNNFEKRNAELDNAKEDLDKAQRAIDKFKNSDVYKNNPDSEGNLRLANKLEAEKLQALAKYEGLLQQANVDWRDHLRSQAQALDGYKSLSNETKRYVENVAKANDIAKIGNVKELAEQEEKMRKLAQAAINIEKAMKGDDTMKVGESSFWLKKYGDNAFVEQEKFIMNLKDTAMQAGLSIDWFNQILNKYMGKTIEAGSTTIDFKGAMNDLRGEMTKGADEVKDLNKAIEKQTRGQKLTYDEVISLTKAHPELQKSWKILNGQIVISTESLLKERDVALQGTRDKIKAKEEEMRLGAQFLAQKLGMTLKEVEMIETVAQAQMKLNELYDMAVDDNADPRAQLRQSQIASSRYSQYGENLKEYAALKESLNEMKSAVNSGFNFETSTDDPLKKNSDKVSAFAKAIDDLNMKLEESKRKLAEYPKSSQEYRDALQEQIDLLKEKQRLIQNELNNPTDYTYGTRNASGGTTTSTSGVKGLQGVLAGKESAFVAAGKQYGVDPALIAAIAMHESGRGSSALARNNKNIAGMTDYTGKFSDGWMHYNTVEDSINDLARQISKYYIQKGLTTIEQIGAKYAPIGAGNDPNGLNNHWVSGVKKFYNEVASNGGTYTVSGNSEDASEAQVYSKQLSLKQDLIKTREDISQLEQDIFNSFLQGWEEKIQDIDFIVKRSSIWINQYRQDLEETSWTNKESVKSINDEYNNQIQYLKNKQKYLHEEANYIRENGKMTDENIQRLKNLGSQWWDVQQVIDQTTKSQRDFNDEYEKFNKDLASKERESAEEAADKIIETWKEAIEKKRDLEIKAIEKTQKENEEAHKKRIDELDEEAKKIEETYQSQIKAIDKEARDEEYADKLKKAQEEVAEIQNKINILSMDNSIEGRQQMKELQKQLKDKQKNLDDLIKDRERENRKEELENTYETNKKINESEKEKADKKLEEQKRSSEEAIKRAEDEAEKLLQNDQYWADRRKEILQGNYTEAIKMLGGYLTEYKTKLEKETEEIAKIIEQNIIKKLQDAMDMLPSVNGDTRGKGENVNSFETYIRNKIKWLTADDSSRTALNTENEKFRQQYGYKDYTKDELFNDPKLQWMVQKYRGEAFKDYVQNKVRWILANQKGNAEEMSRLATINNRMRETWGFKDYTLAELQADPELKKLIQPFGFETGGYTGTWSGNDGRLALLHQKELVLNKDDTSNMLKIVGMVREFIGNVHNISKFIPANETSSSNVTYNITMQIEKLTGDEKGGMTAFNRLVKEVRKKGGAI